MRIINLMEDTEGTRGCAFEHGLSFYIETAHGRLLLDTGATDAFLKNAEILGVDLSLVDTVIISHGHYDHAGGLLTFALNNPRARIYIRQSATGAFYNLKNGQTKYIGMDPDIQKLGGVTFLSGDAVPGEGLYLFGDVTGRRLWPKGNRVLQRKCENGFIQDAFDHEQYLVVREGDKRVLLSGCAHNGILNILEGYLARFGDAPTHVVSGFHLTKQDYTPEDDAIIDETARLLADMSTVFYTGHCTGAYALARMKKIMGDKLVILHAGDTIL